MEKKRTSPFAYLIIIAIIVALGLFIVQRLRQNAALGQSPDIGDTPIIQPQKKGWLEGIF